MSEEATLAPSVIRTPPYSPVEFSAAAGELQAALKTLCDAVSRFEVGAEAG